MAETAYSEDILEVPESISKDLEYFLINKNVENLEIDLTGKCRACLKEEDEMHYLFTDFTDNMTLARVFTECTQYSCEEDDGYASYLCTRCTNILVDFFNLKVQMGKANYYVGTLLGKDIPRPVRYSDVDESDADSTTETIYRYSNDTYIPDLLELSGTPTNCKFCPLTFSTEDECDTHLAKDHGKNPFLKYAEFREQVGTYLKAEENQIREQASNEKASEKANLSSLPGKWCRLCEKRFPEEEFKEHWESHKMNVCEQCGHKFIKKSDLGIHIQSVHSDEKKHVCDICSKAFKIRPLLKRHYRIHLNARSFCCEACGLTFNDNGTLKTHIHIKHGGIRDFICPICGKAFNIKSTLDKHILRHDKNRIPGFFCHVCSSSFQDKSSLKRHHLVKHTDNFVRPSCHACGKTYCSATKLRIHIEKHHGPNEGERKKRRTKKRVFDEKYHISESTDTDKSHGPFEDEHISGPKVITVSSAFCSGTLQDDDPAYIKSTMDHN